MSAMLSSQHEAGQTIERVTKEGKRIIYQLSVIQQPERARACGSGAKSSADRRPVDPPPVVKLRIFDGVVDDKADITFSYDANFFLFATLDFHRPIASGRLPPSDRLVPVLTGMPVSGMAYLDRPVEAGYFIFPDLSVRHEGKYILTFNLYEDTKNPKDKNVDDTLENKKPSMDPNVPQGSFDWRMDVKSNAFTVYSAKKFPGLTESTALSRTVAEQGCRVRIRRDVRMRRREGKGNGEFDDYEEEYGQSRRPAPPESVHDTYSRTRSLSNSGGDRQQSLIDSTRRASGPEFPQQPYQNNYGSSLPGPPQPAASSFPNPPFSGSSQQYQGSQYSQPQGSHPQHHGQFPAGQQTTYVPPPTFRQTAAYGGYHDRPPYANQYTGQRDSYESDYRRSSSSHASAQPHPQYSSADQIYNRSNQGSSYPHYPPRPHSPVNEPPILAPLKMLEPKLDSLARPGPPAPSPTYPDRVGILSFPGSLDPARSAGSKRPYDRAFSPPNQNQPLYNGMRPSNAHLGQTSPATYDDDDESASMEALRMQYKRADGSNHFRDLPILE